MVCESFKESQRCSTAFALTPTNPLSNLFDVFSFSFASKHTKAPPCIYILFLSFHAYIVWAVLESRSLEAFSSSHISYYYHDITEILLLWHKSTNKANHRAIHLVHSHLHLGMWKHRAFTCFSLFFGVVFTFSKPHAAHTMRSPSLRPVVCVRSALHGHSVGCGD